MDRVLDYIENTKAKNSNDNFIFYICPICLKRIGLKSINLDNVKIHRECKKDIIKYIEKLKQNPSIPISVYLSN
jgi:hypothetical protein